jgi:hypothetical protein
VKYKEKENRNSEIFEKEEYIPEEKIPPDKRELEEEKIKRFEEEMPRKKRKVKYREKENRNLKRLIHEEKEPPDKKEIRIMKEEEHLIREGTSNLDEEEDILKKVKWKNKGDWFIVGTKGRNQESNLENKKNKLKIYLKSQGIGNLEELIREKMEGRINFTVEAVVKKPGARNGAETLAEAIPGYEQLKSEEKYNQTRKEVIREIIRKGLEDHRRNTLLHAKRLEEIKEGDHRREEARIVDPGGTEYLYLKERKKSKKMLVTSHEKPTSATNPSPGEGT